MTNRTTRRTFTIAAIAIVVLAAVGFGFYRIGRLRGPGPRFGGSQPASDCFSDEGSKEVFFAGEVEVEAALGGA